MANGYSVIPLDDRQLARDSLEYLGNELLYAPQNLPSGRFPTLSELRGVIQEFGYALEETHDWYVTSVDDYTEIWFSGDVRAEDKPSAFWFRRGDTIVLDIMQALANTCGSFIVADHTGAPSILIVPDRLFGDDTHRQTDMGFMSVIAQRLPVMIERLSNAAAPVDLLFLLSQIRQPIKRLPVDPHALHLSVYQQGILAFKSLLTHEDSRARFLSFDIIATFRHASIETTPLLAHSITSEPDSDTKTRMIWATEAWVAGIATSSSGVPPWTKSLIDALLLLSEDTSEKLPVRFAAMNLAERALPGYWTTTLRDMFINAFVQPNAYLADWHTDDAVIHQVLESIRLLQWQHRIEILRVALPRVHYAQDAHRILRTLLDNLFFGAENPIWMSSLPPEYPAERPAIDAMRLREHASVNWRYPAQVTKLNISALFPIQREILAEVIAYDVPWMVHSNLLEKYGLPPTRAEVKALLVSTT